jgi:hypothetical protein
MGYIRPVSQYNIGKKSEFYSRKQFIEKGEYVAIDNENFANKYNK